jgi:hypothetical protein
MDAVIHQSLVGSFQPVAVQPDPRSLLNYAKTEHNIDLTLQFTARGGQTTALDATLKGKTKTSGYISIPNGWEHQDVLCLHVSDAAAKQFGSALGVNVQNDRLFKLFKTELARRLVSIRLLDSDSNALPLSQHRITVGDE